MLRACTRQIWLMWFMWLMIYLKSVFHFNFVSSIIIMVHSLFCYTCHVLTFSVLHREIQVEEIEKRECGGEARSLEEVTPSCFLFVTKLRKCEV